MDGIWVCVKTKTLNSFAKMAKSFVFNSSNSFGYYSSKYSIIEVEEESPKLQDSIAPNQEHL